MQTDFLAGSNSIENTELAGIIDFCENVKKVGESIFEKDEARKAALNKELTEDIIPRFGEVLEKRIEAYGSGWVFGANLTYIDFFIYHILEFIKL